MSDIFIGRQPIFDADLNLYAYELLFRSREDEEDFSVIDGDAATSRVMLNAFLDIGLENLVGRHQAFINLTQYFLQDPDRIILPPGQIVLEVLEDVTPDELVIATLTTLKKQGHTIALDDFIYHEKLQPLVELANIIKIDIMALANSEIEEHVARFRQSGVKLLAEKVESYEEFEFLKDLNFDYYQGYFFAKPVVVKGKGLESNQLAILRLISRVHDPEFVVAELSEIISTDISLSHKILKFINSAATGLAVQVESIQQAVVLLGIKTIRNWVSIVSLATGTNKPNELGNLALVRARTCENLARASRQTGPESFFTVGLFSVLEAMMDQPLVQLLEELPFPKELKMALLEMQGSQGQALSCAMAMETNNFESIRFMDMELAELSSLYLDALIWSDQQLKAMNL